MMTGNGEDQERKHTWPEIVTRCWKCTLVVGGKIVQDYLVAAAVASLKINGRAHAYSQILISRRGTRSCTLRFRYDPRTTPPRRRRSMDSSKFRLISLYWVGWAEKGSKQAGAGRAVRRDSEIWCRLLAEAVVHHLSGLVISCESDALECKWDLTSFVACQLVEVWC